MIQRLQRQRHRFIRLLPGHARLGNAAAHLHQAVETATIAPRPAPAVGVEADVDQPGGEVLPFASGVTQLLQCIGTVTVEQHVSVLEQRFEYLPAFRAFQVEAGAALAQSHFRYHAGFVPGGRVNAQYIRT